MNTKEQKFFNALRDVFVGAKIEGESGYINLMRIKSRYYMEGVFPQLKKDIDKAVESFSDKFREELFDRLYDFFHRYFSESGSIYFRYTPLHQNIYEKVYTDDKDVMLFWKTHMLYYVKTDRKFQSTTIEIEGQKFFFDASTVEHKKSNEKKEIVYVFSEVRKDGTVSFSVNYSERGKITKTEEILKAIKKAGENVPEDLLQRSFRVFEKQSEIDFFINKDAKAFLEEQFNLWMYQYVFLGESTWNETRIKQLQALKDIAFRIISFISQFENELAKVWNKPKFVLNSNYVITLDKIWGRDKKLVEDLIAHKNIKAQIDEWKELGMLDDKFKKSDIITDDLGGKHLPAPYLHLPIDTKYFKDIELKILGLFDNLDDELDGWLIKSENYQAMNTFQHKFRELINCIHIDPPYNTETSGFLYKNNYQHSSWLTMMENRSKFNLDLLSEEGSFVCHIDENEYERLQLMLEYFSIPSAGTIVWDKKNPMNAGRGIATQHEYIIWRSKQETPLYLRNESILKILTHAKVIVNKYGKGSKTAQKEFLKWINEEPELTGGEKAYRYLDDEGQVYQSVSLRAPEPRKDDKFHKPLIHPKTKKPCPVPPNGFSRTPETLKEMIANGEIIFGVDENTQPRQKMILRITSQRQLSSIIEDGHKGKADLSPLGLDFPYCHPVSLYKEIIGITTSGKNKIVLDHFAGSGTTGHAVINLNRYDGKRRKYILVEMADYFNTVLLPRIKKVVFSDEWKNGKANGGKGCSHFVKYFELEQYESALSNATYKDANLFNDPNSDPYQQYIFLRDTKMLDALEISTKKNSVKVNLTKLYPNIDIAETLSNLTGKWIKRISEIEVEFMDGEKIDLKNLDWKMIKPLIWW